MARVGLLYLREGRWEDRQLLPEEWVRQSTVRRVDVGPNSMGYYVWIPGDPELSDLGWYSLAGNGNTITVVPAENVVFVHRADPLGGGPDGDEIREILLKLLRARSASAATQPRLVPMDSQP